MKFSLIICTYQRPQAIITLLKSVKEQIVYPSEILIIDGSTNDKTAIILKGKTFKKIKYYKVKDSERGLTKQRNYGISKVAEDIAIVCFLDDDTILSPNYFENLLKIYTSNSNAIGVGGYISNEVSWKKSNNSEKMGGDFYYDGFSRKEGIRFKLRKLFGLIDDSPPGFMPKFSHGRSISYLPPSTKTYSVEFFMGGVSSFKKELFNRIKFSTYFEGYGLYEDMDFCLRASKIGQLYVNTSAKLEHHHEQSGRPNKYAYGKMVVRNGWYVWRVKYPNPSLKARFKWNMTVILLTKLRFLNIFTTYQRKEAFTESIGRLVGWFSLFLNKPKIQT